MLELKKAADRERGENNDEEQDGGSQRRTDTGEYTKEQTTRQQEPNNPGEQDRQTKEPSHGPGGSWLTKWCQKWDRVSWRLRNGITMSEHPSLEDMIKQLAEGQRHLQLVWEAHQRKAKEDREALQSALKSQATIFANNQLVHETAMKKLTETIAASKVHPNVPSLVLQRYQEGEDPDSFFTNFERVASSAQWPEDRWGQYIAPLLTGLIQAAYQAANPDGTTPYKDIKKSIFERIGHNTEYYRVRFRKVQKAG
ncbi:hypothetical protein NDU88_003800 [Pleurodeles waltl]|uniref:Uncharacterized protein n=1 Tax=Pleurodeles waltl TaxID=8319 RepID=A0AAV7UZK0_PLEWA|nr:hypothetical protein NDU88_003800 [Pleurodeles waltl]